jgi:putative MATE family efflux protein
MWLAIPLSGAMASQAIINMVDTALVGNLGGLALASVSIGSYLAFILIAIPVGFAIGMQSAMSRYKDHPQYNHWLMAGVSLSALLGILLTTLGHSFSHHAIALYVVDDRMSGIAQTYFDWRLMSIPGIALSLAIRGYWASQHKAWHYSRLLVITHISNIPISYSLIYGLGPIEAMGAAGAGLGTTISIYLGFALQLYTLPRGLFWHNVRIIPSTLSYWFSMIRMALPGAIQQLAFALHLAVLLWIISKLGATALAASFTVLNIGLVILLPLMGLAQATSSLVAQAQRPDYAWKWSKLALQSSIGSGLLSLLIIVLMLDYILPLMLVNREIIKLANLALPVYAFALVFDSFIQIASRSLIATQAARNVAIINILAQWAILLPITAWLVPMYGYMTIWWLQVIYRLSLGLGLWGYWYWHAGLKCSPTGHKEL